MPLVMAVTALYLSFPGCQVSLGDTAVPLVAQHHRWLFKGYAPAARRPWSPGLPSQEKPWVTVPKTVPFEPWFPHVPPKVARANMDRGGIPVVETFIDKMGPG